MTSPSIRLKLAWALFLVILAVLPLSMIAQGNPAAPKSAAASSEPQLIQPEELVAILQSGKNLPLILNIGPRMLYMQAHIRGAEYIGPGSDAEAIKQLRARVQPLSHKAFIVLYCGCCPWAHCPNVQPAYAELRKMGFTNVKLLYIANNIGADWVYKGYPTVLGR